MHVYLSPLESAPFIDVYLESSIPGHPLDDLWMDNGGLYQVHRCGVYFITPRIHELSCVCKLENQSLFRILGMPSIQVSCIVPDTYNMFRYSRGMDVGSYIENLDRDFQDAMDRYKSGRRW